MRDSSSTVPSTIIEDTSLTNPKGNADSFNNYFSNVATGIKSSIKYSRNKFFDFLPQIDINSFFINPTDKTEIKNIIWSLDPLKSIGPNIIPTKILKLLSNDVSTQFAELFNLSLSEGVFPSTLKTCKVFPLYKKDSPLKCSNYRPRSILSNINEIRKRIMVAVSMVQVLQKDLYLFANIRSSKVPLKVLKQVLEFTMLVKEKVPLKSHR